MKKKRLIGIFLMALVMLMSISVLAESNDADYQKGRFYMESFGIDTGNMEYDSPVTRGFAANVLSNALFDELSVTSAMTKFSDVAPDSPYASAAYLLSNSNIMNGDGDKFSPEANITYSQAAKIFVSSLGQDVVAMSKGGYPAGYIAAATSAGIFDGVVVKSDDTLTFGDFAKMYYNFTDCKGFVLSGDKLGSFSKDDTTVLEHKLSRCDMMYVEGVVTGNQYGTVTSDDMGYISIESTSYPLACEIDNDIIGYYASAFLTKKGSKYAVTSIMADPSENNVKIISGSDLAGVDLNQIRYFDGDKAKTLKLSDVSVVRNGKILTTFTKADLVPVNGGMVLIDNNNDNKYEYIYIQNKQYFTVQRTSSEHNVVVLDDGSYEGSTHLYVNPEDEEFYHRIYTADGEAASFEDIKAEDIIRVEGSTEQKVLRVYIVNTTFNGTISEKAPDDEFPVTVNGTAYRVARTANGYITDVSELNFNSTYEFTTDGTFIVKVDKVKSEAAYAYVIDTYTEKSLNSAVHYKVVSDDKQVYEGELADKIVYNGRSVKKENFVPKSGIVISYRIDSEGKICSIDDAELYSAKAKKIYTSATGILYSQTYEYPLFMSEETIVFLVPDSGKDEDFMADLALVNGNTYECESYDYNEDDSSVSVVVIYEDITYDTPGYINSDSPICILKEKKIVLDEEENQVFKLEWLEGKEEKSAFVKSTASLNSTVSKMAKGDVFQYSLTGKGLIDNINSLVRLDQNPAYFHNGANSTIEQVYGKVLEAEYKTLPKGYAAKFVNVFTLDVGEAKEKNFLVTSETNAVSYYYYDSETETVKYGSFDNVMTEDGVLGTFNASEVYIYYYKREAMAVVIKN